MQDEARASSCTSDVAMNMTLCLSTQLRLVLWKETKAHSQRIAAECGPNERMENRGLRAKRLRTQDPIFYHRRASRSTTQSTKRAYQIDRTSAQLS